jgi:hypothetical protein
MQLCATEPFTKGCIVSKESPEQGRWLSARRQLHCDYWRYSDIRTYDANVDGKKPFISACRPDPSFMSELNGGPSQRFLARFFISLLER